jgi:hypothetical protein
LIPGLASSTHDSTKIELVSILADVPLLLTGNENSLYRLFSALGSDRAVSVKIAFLKRTQDLYERAPTSNLRNGIVQVYQNMFTDNNSSVLECIIDPFMLVRFAEMRSPPTMSLVLDLAEKFKTRWRFFAKLLGIVERFPHDCLTSMLSRFLGMIEEAVSLNPQSLGTSAVSFYCFLIRSRIECLSLPDFLRYVHAAYGESTRSHQRVVFLRFAAALLEDFPPEGFVDAVWPGVLAYGGERVPAVRARVLELVVAFGRRFRTELSPVLSGQIDDLTRRYAADGDPQVAGLLRSARAVIGPLREPQVVVCEEHRGLPTIQRPRGSPRAPQIARVMKGSRTLQSTRRAVPPQRLPSPAMPGRAQVVGTIQQSRSTGAVAAFAAPARPRDHRG